MEALVKLNDIFKSEDKQNTTENKTVQFKHQPPRVVEYSPDKGAIDT